MKRTKDANGRWDAVYAHLQRKKGDPPAPPPEPPRPPGGQSYGYFRVSTQRQADEGFSLEGQKSGILKYAADHDLGEVLFFVDPGTSASKVPLADREAGRQLVERVRPGDRVIIPKIDRGFRNFADFIRWHEAWTEAGVALHVVNFFCSHMDSTTPMGRMMVRQLALFAAWESECNRERVKEAWAERKSQGYLYSRRAPLGFQSKRSGKGYIAVPDPVARRLMGMLADWYDDGQSCQDISDHLVAHAIPFPNKYQKEWSQTQVLRLIRAERKLRAAERGQVEA